MVNVKKKEKFTLQFTPEENWQFVCWQAVNSETGEVLDNKVYFENPEKLQTNAYIKEPNEKIQIYAKCIQMPAVVDIGPSTASYANTPITIKFNIPVEATETTAEESLFTFNNIELTCNGENINYLFETPEFNEDKTELKIIPKATKEEGVYLLNYILYELNMGSIEVKVKFSKNITILSGDSTFTLDKNLFSVYYVPSVDEKAPENKKFFITRDSSITVQNAENFSGNKFHNTEITSKPAGMNENTYKDLVFQNACNGTIYIYGRFFENGSGLKNIVINEVQKTNIYGNDTESELVTTEYNEKSPEIEFYTQNDETVFLIKHNIKAQNLTQNAHQPYGGAVSFDVAINDYCYNSYTKHFTIIYIKKINDGKINFIGNTNFPSLSSWTNYDDYKLALKNYVKDITTIYMNDSISFPALEMYNDVPYTFRSNDQSENNLKIQIKYVNTDKETKFADAHYEEGDYNFESIPGYGHYDYYNVKVTFNMDDFEIWPDTSVSLVLTNAYGTVSELEISNINFERSKIIFPSENEIYYPSISEQEDHKKYATFINEKGSSGGSRLVLLRKDAIGNIQCRVCNNTPLETGYTYGLVINGIIQKNCSFTVDNEQLQPLPEVLIDRIEISKYQENGYLNATIFINEDSFTQYDKLFVNGEDITGKKSFALYFTDYLIFHRQDTEPKLNIGTITGYKNNMSTQKSCEITKISRASATPAQVKMYDNSNPVFLSSMDGDKLVITMKDNWSGVDKGIVYIKDEILTFDSEHTTQSIPMWKYFYSTKDISNIHFTGSDKAGCTVDELKPNTVFFAKPFYIKIAEDDPYYDNQIIAECSFENSFNGFYYYLSGENFATKHTKPDGKPLDLANWTYGYINKNKFSSVDDGSYIKIIYEAYFDQYDASERANPNGETQPRLPILSNPMYYYKGTPGNKKNDFMIPNGSSKESMVVCSDRKVLVHTIATSRPYSECRNWDYTEWEYFKEFVSDEEILDCGITITPDGETDPVDTPTMRVYTVPEGIKKGQNYVVIAHYSNNNVIMSDVMTK